MKRTIMISLVLVLISSLAHSDLREADINITGHDWTNWEHEIQVIYLKGLLTGFAMGVASDSLQEQEEKVKINLPRSLETLYQLVLLIDAYYQTTENYEQPVVGAIFYIRSLEIKRGIY